LISILEKVKCHDIIVFREGKSLSDQMQPVRENLKNELEDAISRRVDVLTYKSLHPRLKDRILAEQVQII
jgi:predicted nucleotidyltransferase